MNLKRNTIKEKNIYIYIFMHVCIYIASSNSTKFSLKQHWIATLEKNTS